MNFTRAQFDASRIILFGVIWLSFGAACSLGGAWGHAWLWPTAPVIRQWSSGAGGVPVSASSYHGAMTAIDGVRVDWYVMLGGSRPVFAESYGWPVACWEAWFHDRGNGRFTLIMGVPLRAGRATSTPMIAPAHALPIVPDPIPALASSALWGLVVFATANGVRLARRARRRRLSRCVACGYPMGELSGAKCPECGHA